MLEADTIAKQAPLLIGEQDGEQREKIGHPELHSDGGKQGAPKAFPKAEVMGGGATSSGGISAEFTGTRSAPGNFGTRGFPHSAIRFLRSRGGPFAVLR